MSGGSQSLSLAERLRNETRSLHEEVEQSTFIATLLRGQLSREAYCALLRNLYEIYEALEATVAAASEDLLIRAVFVPELGRVSKIESDLDVLHGSNWRSAIVISSTTKIYADRIRGLASGITQRSVVVSHIYVRYLGDLSGGQLLQSIVRRSMGLPDDRGTAFYDFGGRASAERLARHMRSGFGSLNLEPSHTQAIVQEAIWAFRAHGEIFAELASQYLGSQENPEAMISSKR
jgi:heme oxygenase